MTMTEKLDMLMHERGLNKAELARSSGIPYMTIVNFYEKGTENVKRSTLLKLASFFGVTVDYLAVDEETSRTFLPAAPGKRAVSVPSQTELKPRLSASLTSPHLMDAVNFECFDEVSSDVKCDFSLLVPGDHLRGAGMREGDVAFVRLSDTCKTNDVAAAQRGLSLSLRRIYVNGSQILLVGERPADKPTLLTENGDTRIVGRVVSSAHPKT